jgi:hypothetical protein
MVNDNNCTFRKIPNSISFILIRMTKKKTFATFNIKLLTKYFGYMYKRCTPKNMYVSDKRFCTSPRLKWCDAIKKMNYVPIEYVNCNVNSFNLEMKMNSIVM